MRAYYKGKYYYPKKKKAKAKPQTKKPTPKKVVGKVGYCDNRTLGIKNKQGKFSGGHYVYIRTAKDGTCDVNVITSLESSVDKFNAKRLAKVKQGYLYPIPKSDSNFELWSAVNLDGNVKNIPIEKIQDIGKKGFKDRHKFYVGKFTKEK